MTKIFYQELSNTILKSANKVHSYLGYGLAENCYREALMIEFKRQFLQVEKESSHKVYYNGQVVGQFRRLLI